MITEQQLKSQCTSDIIKRIIELAEGFEYYKDYSDKIKLDFFTLWSDDDEVLCTAFPLLIHRTVEGWNKKINDIGIIICEGFVSRCGKKDYMFKNYQPQSLTQCECAILDCLLDTFKNQRE